MLTGLGCRRAREFMTNEARALWMCGSRGTLTLHILWPTVQPGHGGLAPPRKTYITPRRNVFWPSRGPGPPQAPPTPLIWVILGNGTGQLAI